MKLVILSIGDETFSVPVDSVQLLNKEIEKVPTKIKFDGAVFPVLKHPFIEKTVADTMQQQAEQTISLSEQTISDLNSQITTLQQKLESIKSEVATLVNHLNAD